MPRRDRVDPWGDLHAAPGRGLLTGNRGCLVDEAGEVVRHHASVLWISCLTEFRGWRWPLAAPRRWTPIFFLDDAVALAAGHRPCGLCRREAYRSYRGAVTAAVGSSTPLSAGELNRRLASERLAHGGRRSGEGPAAVGGSGGLVAAGDRHRLRRPPAVAGARGSPAPFHLRRVGTSEPQAAPGDGAASPHLRPWKH